MAMYREWLLSFKHSLVLPTKCYIVKLASSFRHKARGRSNGLMGLCKDMESCGEYTDIQVMWELIQSSCPHSGGNNNTKTRNAHWRFCFSPN